MFFEEDKSDLVELFYDPSDYEIIEQPSTQKSTIPLSLRRNISFLAPPELASCYGSDKRSEPWDILVYQDESYLDVSGLNGCCVLFAVACSYLVSCTPYEFVNLHELLSPLFHPLFKDAHGKEEREAYELAVIQVLSKKFQGLSFSRGYPSVPDATEFLLDYGVTTKGVGGVLFVPNGEGDYHAVVRLPPTLGLDIVSPKEWCSEKALAKFNAADGFRNFVDIRRSYTGDSDVQAEIDELVSWLCCRNRSFWIVNTQTETVRTIISGRGVPSGNEFVGIRHFGDLTGTRGRGIGHFQAPAGHWEWVRFVAKRVGGAGGDKKKKEYIKKEDSKDTYKKKEVSVKQGNKYFFFRGSDLHVNTVFKMGKDGERYLRDNHPDDIGEGSFKQPYGHPFCRFSTDYLTLKALHEIVSTFKKGEKLIEVAAKYNRTIKMLERSDLKENFLIETCYEPWRPDLTQYDRNYNAKYTCKVPVMSSKVDKETIMQAKHLLLVDCAYYPNVLDGVYNSILMTDSTAHIIVQEVHSNSGRYVFDDGEGSVLVYKDKNKKVMIDNRPKGNDKVYKHPRIDWPYGFQMIKKDGLDIRAIERIRVGPSVNMLYVTITKSRLLEEEALAFNLSDGYVPQTFSDILLDIQMGSDLVPPVYRHEVRETISAFLAMKGNMEEFTKEGSISACLNYVNAVTRLKLEMSMEFCQLTRDVYLQARKERVRHAHIFDRSLYVYLERVLVYMYLSVRNHKIVDMLRKVVKKEASVGGWFSWKKICDWWLLVLTCLIWATFASFMWSNFILIYLVSRTKPFVVEFYDCVIYQECYSFGWHLPFYTFLFVYSYGVLTTFRKMVKQGLDTFFLTLIIITTYLVFWILGDSYVPSVGSRGELRYDYFSGKSKIVSMSEGKVDALKNADLSQMKSLVEPQFYSGQNTVTYGEFVRNLDWRPIKRIKDTIFNVLPSSLYWLGPSIPSSDKLYGAWGFFIRHVTPKVLPDPKFKPELDKFIDSDGILASMRRIVDRMDMDDFETYLKKVDRSKQKSYRKGYDRFKRSPIIPLDLQIIAKPDEKQYKDVSSKFTSWLRGETDTEPVENEYKARNIFNPSDQVKAILGWFGHNLQRVTKEVEDFEGMYCQGWTTEDLERHLIDAWNTVENPVGFSYDGGNHDAHQHGEYLKTTDNYIIGALVRPICAKMSLSDIEINEISKKLLREDVPVRMFSDASIDGCKLFGGSRIILMKGILHTTVFSGHPTRTTWGNTYRQLILMKKIAKSLGMRWRKDIWVFQGGDDFYCVINSKYYDLFVKELDKYYSKVEGVTHGWGQLMKDFQFLGNRIDFLSKTGFAEPGSAMTMKKFERIVWTGLVTTSVGRTMTLADYYCSIRKMVNVCYGNVRGIASVLNWRDRFYGHLKGQDDKKEKVFELVRDVRHEHVSDADLYKMGQIDAINRVESCLGNPEALSV